MRPDAALIASLERANLHPLWDRYQRITPIRPQPKDTPFLWRWREVEPYLHRSVGEVAINDIERRALILAHPAFGAETTTTSTMLAARRSNQNQCAPRFFSPPRDERYPAP